MKNLFLKLNNTSLKKFFNRKNYQKREIEPKSDWFKFIYFFILSLIFILLTAFIFYIKIKNKEYIKVELNNTENKVENLNQKGIEDVVKYFESKSLSDYIPSI